MGTAAIARGSFGLSTTSAGAMDASNTQSEVGSNCISDYITIPNGVTLENAMLTTDNVMLGNNRFCGRYLNPMDGGGAESDATVCSRATPFRISVVTDANEVLGVNAAVGNAKTNEASGDDNTEKKFTWNPRIFTSI